MVRFLYFLTSSSLSVPLIKTKLQKNRKIILFEKTPLPLSSFHFQTNHLLSLFIKYFRFFIYKAVAICWFIPLWN
jgi:hypothetical protein